MNLFLAHVVALSLIVFFRDENTQGAVIRQRNLGYNVSHDEMCADEWRGVSSPLPAKIAGPGKRRHD